MALLELHLKKTDPELRTNYMASDYPIEHLFHDCGLGLSDILDKLMQRTIKPLRELLTMDAAALVDRVQKLRMSMRAEPSPSSSSSSSSSATSMAGLLPASSLSGSSLNSASTSGLPFRTTYAQLHGLFSLSENKTGTLSTSRPSSVRLWILSSRGPVRLSRPQPQCCTIASSRPSSCACLRL